jgi:hypothetical protein
LVDTFNVISGICTILSFLFAVWVWMRADLKVRELEGRIRSIHEIARLATWEAEISLNCDDEERLKSVDKMNVTLRSIVMLTTPGAIGEGGSWRDEGQLIERGMVWTLAMCLKLEKSPKVPEVWIVTQDFRPDASDPVLGKMIADNLKHGKRYAYFYRDDMPQLKLETERLVTNIRVDDLPAKAQSRLTLVPVSQPFHDRLFSKGTLIVFYFRDQKRALPPECFEEIVFTHVRERGVFWKKLDEKATSDLQHILEKELERSPTLHPSP